MLARTAAAAGTSTIVATPHVSWRYPNDANTIAQLTNELNERLRAESIPLQVLPGAEIAMTRLLDIDPNQLRSLGLGGTSWLLIEPPFTPVVTGLDSILLDLHTRGHRILLAHPERCHAFHRDRAMLESLVRSGVLTSITAGSLIGSFGTQVRRFALGLIRDGLVHNIASDAHDHAHRPPTIAAEIRHAGLDSLADWLTCQVPEAILENNKKIPSRPIMDEPVGAGPNEAPQRKWWRRNQ